VILVTQQRLMRAPHDEAQVEFAAAIPQTLDPVA
jgi:hypothetical protein